MEVSVSQAQVGAPAPEFSLPSTAPSGTTSLAELRGRKVVLAFYVYDFTGG
jgi:peroxiredoxin